MDTKVKEFLEAAKSKEREAFEKERDKHLISLGLIKEGESIREYSDRYVYPFTLWDKEKQKYYYDKKVPINVTDDEYEEIKKYSTKEVVEETTKLNKGAEKFLGVINGINLAVGIIITIGLIYVAIISYQNEGLYAIASIVVLLTSLISYAIVKVVLNISYNLHEINSKQK
ncbi:MAG: hypothetical protein MR292_00060 [Alistipes sp.]|nr:hypothetical protein [Alistipes sp.]